MIRNLILSEQFYIAHFKRNGSYITLTTDDNVLTKSCHREYNVM